MGTELSMNTALSPVVGWPIQNGKLISEELFKVHGFQETQVMSIVAKLSKNGGIIVPTV